MPSIETLLEQNRVWATRLQSDNPSAFQKMSEPQHPRHCIIGCSDSRIPVHEMLGIQPGQMFVHRNIANMVSHQDLSCLAVIQYAVEILEVERIIVCGHYGCGGITAALKHKKLGLADYWLHQLQVEADSRHSELEGLTEKERINHMCEWNVRSQVDSVVSTAIVRNAWKEGKNLYVHGWIFSQKTGLVTPLIDAIGPESLR
jgi:carbonic anhydrase